MEKGRFAPSPTGRMHLGNIWAALLSFLSVKKKGGSWILRHEDLDRQRSRREYALLIEDDLHWLGLEWDEGGLNETGVAAPYSQSLRAGHYEETLRRLADTGRLYPCVCRRADLLAASAPHAADGTPVYAGTCRPATMPLPPADCDIEEMKGKAIRLWVGNNDSDSNIIVEDMLFGRRSYSLSTDCGDFIVRRADGNFAYQLAVVTDDIAMGVTEVVRGCDLLSSAARQIYLYRLLGHSTPRYGHIPLLCNAAGQRLSKRDNALSMTELRKHYSPQRIIGYLAYLAGLTDSMEELSPRDLIPLFSWDKLPDTERVITTTQIPHPKSRHQ